MFSHKTAHKGARLTPDSLINLSMQRKSVVLFQDLRAQTLSKGVKVMQIGFTLSEVA